MTTVLTRPAAARACVQFYQPTLRERLAAWLLRMVTR